MKVREGGTGEVIEVFILLFIYFNFILFCFISLFFLPFLSTSLSPSSFSF